MNQHPTTAHASVCALLPAWQAADFIQATLDSLSAQTYAHFSVCLLYTSDAADE